MSFLNSFIIKILNKKIGEDNFGNQYYENIAKGYSGKKKRYVLYKGKAEPSKVPPLWHSWLHYLSDEVPTNVNNYKWQKDYLPNLTGTKLAYNPKIKNGLSCKISANYSIWQPKE